MERSVQPLSLRTWRLLHAKAVDCMVEGGLVNVGAEVADVADRLLGKRLAWVRRRNLGRRSLVLPPDFLISES